MKEILQKPAPVEVPTDDESVFAIKLKNELFEQFVDAKKSDRHMESFVLLWTLLEQFYIPDLISLISRRLKLDVPQGLSDMHASQSFKLYYYLSHDKELYDDLERCRKKRNKLMHRMYDHESWEEIQEGFKNGPKEYLVPAVYKVMDRFKGKTPIPVLNLYSNGWNDHRKKIDLVLKEMME